MDSSDNVTMSYRNVSLPGRLHAYKLAHELHNFRHATNNALYIK